VNKANVAKNKLTRLLTRRQQPQVEKPPIANLPRQIGCVSLAAEVTGDKNEQKLLSGCRDA
jgi:hypothetical protein